MGSCIYKLYDGREVVYVGKTTCLSSRLSGHKDKEYTSVGYIDVDETHLSAVEEYMISLFVPKYNKQRPTAMILLGEYLFNNYYASSTEHSFHENKIRYADKSGSCWIMPIKLLRISKVRINGKDYKLSSATKVVYMYCHNLCVKEEYTYIGEQCDIAISLGVTTRTVTSCMNTLREMGVILSTYINGKLCYKLGEEL